VSADIERLQAELRLAKLGAALEEARKAMHADRSPASIAVYTKAAQKMAEARTAFRLAYPVTRPSSGDAIATPETVKVESRVHRP